MKHIHNTHIKHIHNTHETYSNLDLEIIFQVLPSMKFNNFLFRTGKPLHDLSTWIWVGWENTGIAGLEKVGISIISNSK